MRTIKVKIVLNFAALLLLGCAHTKPQTQTASTPSGTAVLVADAGQALIYRVEQRGQWQVFATARSLESLPEAGVLAVDRLNLDAPLQHTADTLVRAMRAQGLPAEQTAVPLPSLHKHYQQVLVLAVKRAGVAQAHDAGDWPRAVYEISAEMRDLQTGATVWRSNAEQQVDLPLADVIEAVPEAGAETLLRTSRQANADLLQTVLDRMAQRELASSF